MARLDISEINGTSKIQSAKSYFLTENNPPNPPLYEGVLVGRRYRY